MNMDDQQIIDEISYERNHSKRTKATYTRAVKNYTAYCGLSLHELLTEADNEEEDGVRWKKRTLRKRLIHYRKYLVENYNIRTVEHYFGIIRTIYKHYEIEIHTLPPLIKKGNVIKSQPIHYEDLPSKDLIRQGLGLANPLMKAMILFMSSSGTAKQECLNIKVKDYVLATKEYHNLEPTTDLNNILNKIDELLQSDITVVPKFDLVRQKTAKPYFTFCSPEAVQSINDYLFTRKNLTLDSPLFKVHERYLTELFMQINDTLGLGMINNNRIFRPHMLRKFHASNMVLGDDGLSIVEVDSLQGRTRKNVTHKSYFFDDYKSLRKKYIRALPNVLINYEVKSLTIETEEYLLLKRENERLQLENQRIKDSIAEEVHKQIQEQLYKSYLKAQQKLE